MLTLKTLEALSSELAISIWLASVSRGYSIPSWRKIPGVLAEKSLARQPLQ